MIVVLVSLFHIWEFVFVYDGVWFGVGGSGGYRVVIFIIMYEPFLFILFFYSNSTQRNNQPLEIYAEMVETKEKRIAKSNLFERQIEGNDNKDIRRTRRWWWWRLDCGQYKQIWYLRNCVINLVIFVYTNIIMVIRVGSNVYEFTLGLSILVILVLLFCSMPSLLKCGGCLV